MPKKLEFKFDPNQDFQLEAIQAVVDVFQGLPRHDSGFALGDNVVPNLPPYEVLDESWLYNNVRAVQNRNDPENKQLERSLQLNIDQGLELKGVSDDSWRYPSFTIEMETGTGKTYVYLRTIHELRKRYGFSKFVIVVPSVAIYEGVVKNFEVTESHFAALYGNETVHLTQYDGQKLGELRSFANSSFLEIMVITLQSFRRQNNRIFRHQEQLPGEWRPYEYLQAVRPILILDEPQNMETPKAKAALRTLNPLFALRYSATHRTTPNHLYCLTPFDAYQRGLVKRIQVEAVTEQNNFNQPYLEIESISSGRGGIRASIRTRVLDEGRTREDTVTLGQGDDLHDRSDREEHAQGYIVEEIHAGEGYVRFTNGLQLNSGHPVGPTRRSIFRVQIERTVLQHMQRQSELRQHDIKVLSLFFIDRVAKYVDDDGIIKRLFDQAFDKYKRHFPHFRNLEAPQVRDGYFACLRRRGRQTEYIDTDGSTKREREAERSAYALIMQRKEQLLSFDEPVSFIFAHSALKEGWDNPNVFQICTLNQTVSTMKKRQEIGRGLRLPVDQTGERSFNEDINILTVVANESYDSYAENLQREYCEDGHFNPPPKPSEAGKATVCRNDEVFDNEHFQRFWQHLILDTDYRINIDTPLLIDQAVERLEKENTRFPDAVIVIETGQYVDTEITVTFERMRGAGAKIRFRRVDTRDTELEHALYFEEGRRTDLFKAFNEPRLRDLVVDSIISAGDNSCIEFKNGMELLLGESYTFHTQEGQRPRRQQVTPDDQDYPIFNLIDRAARATDLTRPTLNTIFQRLSERIRRKFLANPEGFANVFIPQVREALADHIVDNIEFVLKNENMAYNLESLFPSEKEFPQRELVEASAHGVYDRVQIDSDVEREFVQRRLNQREDVIGFFKFPPGYRISFPKIVGNYNPDWGILRRDENDQTVLELVRETKGTEDPAQLQFPHERRKIKAAVRHFDRIGLDYRVVTDKTEEWWKPRSDVGKQHPMRYDEAEK